MSRKSQVRLWPFIVVLGQLLAGWRAERNYLSLPEIPYKRSQDAFLSQGWPGISVIVPARNEEANLPRLLDTLVAQDYPLYEVLVVDDASSDATAEVVLRYAEKGVRLLQSDGPPVGWTGKNHACCIGAGDSVYPWLLFVDADTMLARSALSSSAAFALEQNILALSLFARQHCETFWERLLLPFAFQHYFVAMNAHYAHSMRGPALGNGQYFLIERDAYQRAGGHGANAGSLIDDIALATSLKRIGVIPLACRGEKLVTVRMYTSLTAIIQGFSKNSYLFLRQSPVTGMQTAISTSLAASIPMLFVDAFRARSKALLGVAGLAYLIQMVALKSWLQRFGVHPLYILLAPFAALGFLAIALNSMGHVLTGRSLVWKGRSYRSRRPARSSPDRDVLRFQHAHVRPVSSHHQALESKL